MMAAAENIAYLRSILSIVAEETGALKMEDADEDSVGWTTKGPLPMTFGHVRRAHAALAALEAALSAAERVAARYDFDGCGFQYIDNGSGSDWKTRHPDAEMLYDRPQQSAPSVAVKVPPMPETEDRRPLDDDNPDGYLESNSDWADNNNDAVEWLADNHAAIRSALSAQVQDAEEINEEMSLAVALDFADNPRPYHTLQAPADTNGELYRALRTIAAAYRSAQVQDVARWQLVPKEPTQEMLDAADRVRPLPEFYLLDAYRAMLAAAPAKQEGGHVTSK